ncbi:Hpt domain-containing protein [Dokdonia sp. PRO95]|uniref:Hpt domain-containing protein n=1 Tax=Dokdonia sp. PRO95 TaxID=1239415 RepID=UPI00068F65E8|nr:Hpt domain-containing protein [Dokdonia sp. PRO95]
MEKPNLNYIKELSGGDAGFEKKLIGVVQAELPQEIAEYEGNMKDSAFAKAAENVHKIKHKLGIVGLEKGYELAIAYEDELKEGKSTLKEEFDNILTAVIHFIKDL